MRWFGASGGDALVRSVGRRCQGPGDELPIARGGPTCDNAVPLSAKPDHGPVILA